MISAWLNTAVSAIGTAGLVAGLGAAFAAVWAALGWWLGRVHDRRAGSA